MMSQYQNLVLKLNINNNPTNFKEQHNIGESIISNLRMYTNTLILLLRLVVRKPCI
ncbi:hypothetical protein MtrunA17_Chr4g0022141 [Medicago truncatula]|uniref:Uncharacterized protein n=1 Tax=Medicago truncatula TaxID=3880 RepID=A0A396I908_MEDTR|nr:hypothetical protein MtrunA17_Chr4g0022141 [Medicago truncatula]